MKNFSQYFANASESCREVGLLTKHYSFSERENPTELYTVTTLHLCKQHSKAISILLNNELYIDALVISRNIMELFFNIEWIKDSRSRAERIKKVFQLEGTAFSSMEKGIKMMEEDAKKDKLFWQEDMFKENKETFDLVKNIYSHLLKKNKNDDLVFMKAPPFDKKMNPMYKLKFYNLYRDLSSFVHPSPLLREFTLLRADSEDTPLQIIEKHYPNLLVNVLFFIYGILENSTKLLSEKMPDKKNKMHSINLSYYEKIKLLPRIVRSS